MLDRMSDDRLLALRLRIDVVLEAFEKRIRQTFDKPSSLKKSHNVSILKEASHIHSICT